MKYSVAIYVFRIRLLFYNIILALQQCSAELKNKEKNRKLEVGSTFRRLIKHLRVFIEYRFLFFRHERSTI